MTEPTVQAECDRDFEHGHRYLLRVLPSADTAWRGRIICVQSFAEEQNACRRLLIEQAIAFGRAGYGCSLLDLYGTGDSAGTIAQASWQQWRADLARLRARTDGPVIWWTVRTGLLLASALIEPHDAVLGWMPLADGRTLGAQLSRLARLRRLTGKGDTADADSHAHAVPGYPFDRAMVDALTAARVGAERLASDLAWFDVGRGGTATDAGGAASAAAMAQRLTERRFDGPPFWSTPDQPAPAALAQQLAQASQQWLDALPDPARFARAIEPPAALPAGASATGGERSHRFGDDRHELAAIIHAPIASSRPTTGVLILAGQPQTRYGAHRLFVELARGLAAQGATVMRVDLPGFGDALGPPAHYLHAGAHLQAAVSEFRRIHSPDRLILCGLCDGATTIALTNQSLAQRADQLWLINPFVEDEQVAARALLRGHYANQLRNVRFWRRLFGGDVRIGTAMRDALDSLRSSWRAQGPADESGARRDTAGELAAAIEVTDTLVCLSGNDLVAARIEALLSMDRRWQRLGKRLTVRRIAQADHTLSVPRHARELIALLLDQVTAQPIADPRRADPQAA